MDKKFFFALIVLLLFFGCTKEQPPLQPEKEPAYELKDFLEVLDENQDFKDYKNDFFKATGKDFEPKITDEIKLTKEVINKRISKLKEDSGTAPFASIYENLPESNNLYLIELHDKNEEKRGCVAVIDMKEKKVLKFFGLLRIIVSISGNQ